MFRDHPRRVRRTSKVRVHRHPDLREIGLQEVQHLRRPQQELLRVPQPLSAVQGFPRFALKLLCKPAGSSLLLRQLLQGFKEVLFLT